MISYLLSPFEQYSNINGHPLVGGHITVCYAGTQIPYFCYSDWTGATHPKDILIPNDGRLCVLADSDNQYDVYLYSSNGNLISSRLNISTQSQEIVTETSATVINTDGTINVQHSAASGLNKFTIGVNTDVIATVSALSGVSANLSQSISTEEQARFVGDQNLSRGLTSLDNKFTGLLNNKDNWDSTYNTVLNNSANWANAGEPGWSANSATTIDVNNTVINNSASWASGTSGKTYTGISPVVVDNENDTIGVNAVDYYVKSPLYVGQSGTSAFIGIDTTGLESNWGTYSATTLDVNSSYQENSASLASTYNTVLNNSANWAQGHTYSGISPIVVNNETNQISADYQDVSAVNMSITDTGSTIVFSAHNPWQVKLDGADTEPGYLASKLIASGSNVHIVNENNVLKVGVDSLVGDSFMKTAQANGSVGNSYGTSLGGSYYFGNTCSALGDYSFAQGASCLAQADRSHAEGYQTSATGRFGHSEGNWTIAEGDDSHSEGYLTRAVGLGSHAEGSNTSAVGNYSHSEGSFTIASGDYSHAEGFYTQALGQRSLAVGWYTSAVGSNSFAGGAATLATESCQTSLGFFNAETSATFVVGCGTSNSNRKNALEVYKTGLVSARQLAIEDHSLIWQSATDATQSASWVDGVFYVIPE